MTLNFFRIRSHDGGAAAIVVAISMLVLMGFAALVVDLGAGFNERAQDQSASDVAALAALREFQGSAIGSNDPAADEVIRIASVSLATSPGTTPSLTDWAGCTSDPGRDAAVFSQTVPAITGECFSFSSNHQKTRVRVPVVDVGTTFGRVLSSSGIPVSAFTEAGVYAANSADILPFGLPGPSDGVGSGCLKAFPNPKSLPSGAFAPCTLNGGPSSLGGDFGSLDISLYGAEVRLRMGYNPFETATTPLYCGNKKTNEKLVANISIGSDHALSVFTGGTPRLDSDGCSTSLKESNVSWEPNRVSTQSGVGSNLDMGLLGKPALVDVDAKAISGRLVRTPNVFTAYPAVEIRPGVFADNVPLWRFIPTAGPPGTVPAACNHQRSWFNTPLIVNCLDAYWAKPSGTYDPLFTADSDGDPANGVWDVMRTTRFAWVPKVNGSLKDAKEHNIADFRAVYLTSLMLNCSANDCDMVWNAGDDFTSVYHDSSNSSKCKNPTATGSWCSTNAQVYSLGAMLIPDDALPNDIVAGKPGNDAQLRAEITR